jgi:hypothetical protein
MHRLQTGRAKVGGIQRFRVGGRFQNGRLEALASEGWLRVGYGFRRTSC